MTTRSRWARDGGPDDRVRRTHLHRDRCTRAARSTPRVHVEDQRIDDDTVEIVTNLFDATSSRGWVKFTTEVARSLWAV
jgi:hypothetical protein